MNDSEVRRLELVTHCGMCSLYDGVQWCQHPDRPRDLRDVDGGRAYGDDVGKSVHPLCPLRTRPLELRWKPPA